MIETTLSREAAEKWFRENSVLFDRMDFMPDYRVYELFGERAVNFFVRPGRGDFQGGRDWITIKDRTAGRSIVMYTREGFFKFAEFHNYAVMTKERSKSRAAAAADQKEAELSAQIERADAETLAETARAESEA